MKQNELKHYGVKGMKWGIIRTKFYTKNSVGDTYTDRQKKKMTKRAIKILNSEKKTYDTLAEDSRAKADISYKRADMAKMREYNKRAKQFLKQSEIMNQKISDIETGKVKAGRDFVTNSEYYTMPLLDMLGYINVQSKHRIDY